MKPRACRNEPLREAFALLRPALSRVVLRGRAGRPLESHLHTVLNHAFDWFVYQGPTLSADFRDSGAIALLRQFFTDPEVGQLEDALRAVAPRGSSRTITLREPSDDPTATALVTITRDGNRRYSVVLVDARRLYRGTLRRLDLNPQPPGDGYRIQFTSVREVIADARTSYFSVRFRIVALGVVSSHCYTTHVDESTPNLSLAPTRRSLEIHALPPMTEATLETAFEQPTIVNFVTTFSPALSPGHVADFTLRLERSNAKAFTLEEVALRRAAGTYNYNTNVVPACEFGIRKDTERFHASTLLPVGYEIGPRTYLEVRHAYSRVRLPEEERRVRDAGATLKASKHRGRWWIHLTLNHGRADTALFTFFTPPSEAELPPELRLKLPLAHTAPVAAAPPTPACSPSRSVLD